MVKVLKIGGSILTDKTRPACPRSREIIRIAGEIASASSGLILIHGAGSFGHVPAKKYGMPENFSPKGLRITHSCVAKLNDMVVEALGRAGVNCMPVHPFDCTILKDGRIESMEVQPIIEMIKSGLIPVLHGDVAMDRSKITGIVSGDQLVSYLAKALKAEVVALGTDVDGVIFNDQILEKVTRKDLSMIEAALGSGPGADVTGGMKGKVIELLDLADQGISSMIFNAGKEGRIKMALRGEPIGTIVGRSV